MFFSSIAYAASTFYSFLSRSVVVGILCSLVGSISLGIVSVIGGVCGTTAVVLTLLLRFYALYYYPMNYSSFPLSWDFSGWQNGTAGQATSIVYPKGQPVHPPRFRSYDSDDHTCDIETNAAADEVVVEKTTTTTTFENRESKTAAHGFVRDKTQQHLLLQSQRFVSDHPLSFWGEGHFKLTVYLTILQLLKRSQLVRSMLTIRSSIVVGVGGVDDGGTQIVSDETTVTSLMSSAVAEDQDATKESRISSDQSSSRKKIKAMRRVSVNEEVLAVAAESVASAPLILLADKDRTDASATETTHPFNVQQSDYLQHVVSFCNEQSKQMLLIDSFFCNTALVCVRLKDFFVRLMPSLAWSIFYETVVLGAFAVSDFFISAFFSAQSEQDLGSRHDFVTIPIHLFSFYRPRNSHDSLEVTTHQSNVTTTSRPLSREMNDDEDLLASQDSTFFSHLLLLLQRIFLGGKSRRTNQVTSERTTTHLLGPETYRHVRFLNFTLQASVPLVDFVIHHTEVVMEGTPETDSVRGMLGNFFTSRVPDDSLCLNQHPRRRPGVQWNLVLSWWCHVAHYWRPLWSFLLVFSIIFLSLMVPAVTVAVLVGTAVGASIFYSFQNRGDHDE